jgi:hypothetical protein
MTGFQAPETGKVLDRSAIPALVTPIVMVPLKPNVLFQRHKTVTKCAIMSEGVKGDHRNEARAAL